MDRLDEASLFDPFDIETYAKGHPWAAYDRLRETDPIWRHPGTAKQPIPVHILTRHEDIFTVSHDSARFISSGGSKLQTDKKAGLDPRIARALVRTITSMDAPDHTIMRKLVNPFMSPIAVKKMEDGIRDSVARLMERLKGRSDVEFVAEVAAVVPIETLCGFLDIPEADRAKIFDWTNMLAGLDDPLFAPSQDDANKNLGAIFDYGKWLINERKKNPKDDILSAVAAMDLENSPIGEAARDAFIATFIAAGNETTRNSFTGSVIALARNPDQKKRLIDDPALIPGAIDELLRYVTPVFQMMRTASGDTELSGRKIGAGERLLLLYGAANRDPALFADPHKLDVTRENAKRHLAFGTGIHHCVGWRLAVAQLRALLPQLLSAFPDFTLAGEPQHLRSNFICAVRELPVRLQ